MPVIVLKIVSAFFEIWWVVSDDMRVCNFCDNFQHKRAIQRKAYNGKTRKHIRAKMNTQAYIAQNTVILLN